MTLPCYVTPNRGDVLYTECLYKNIHIFYFKCMYHVEEIDNPLPGTVLMVIVPDDAYETDNVFKLWSDFTGLEHLKLLARRLQDFQEFHI